MNSIIPIFKSSLSIMIPIFFAALGGLFPALCGSLNIALEGLLLAGAFSSLAVFYFTGNIAISVLSAICASLLLSLLHILAVFKLRANLFISGLAVNLFSSGICIVLSDKIFKTRGVVAREAAFQEAALQEAANSVPWLLNRYLIIAFLVLLVSWLAIYKTPFGFRLRACEKNSQSLISLGINPNFYQITAVLISGFFCGIGGSFLSLKLGAFVPGMSAGKGWIALAVIFLGAKKPFGILAAAFVFALTESFSNYLQGLWNIPADFILAFPYVCSLVAIIVVSVMERKKN